MCEHTDCDDNLPILTRALSKHIVLLNLTQRQEESIGTCIESYRGALQNDTGADRTTS